MWPIDSQYEPRNAKIVSAMVGNHVVLLDVVRFLAHESMGLMSQQDIIP